MAAPQRRVREVFVAVDASEHSAHAWKWTAAVLLPSLSDCHVRLVSVAVPELDPLALEDDATVLMCSKSQDVVEAQRIALEEADALLVRLGQAHELPETCSIGLVALPLRGGVGQTLLEELKHRPADIVVVGSRGMGAVRRFLSGVAQLFGDLGSVSSFAVSKFDTAVTVVKLPVQ